MLKNLAPITLGLSAVAASVMGQAPTRHVSGYAFEEDAWRLVAVHSGSGNASRVDAFVAVAKADVTTGDNIVVIAYVRGATDLVPWTAKSWTTTDRAAGIKNAKFYLNIDDADDGNWGFDGPIGAPAPQLVEPAKDYVNGVMTDDPMYWFIMASPNQDEVVTTFAEWGMKVADLKLEQEAPGCTVDLRLTAMAKGVETAMPYVISDEATGRAVAALGAQTFAALSCQPVAPPPPPPAPPPPATPCVRGPVTPWFVTPLALRFTPAAWGPPGAPVTTPVAAGASVTCTYAACQTWAQFRSCMWLTAACTIVPCTQIQTTSCCVTASCTVFVAGPGPYFCPATPACAGWPPGFPTPFAVPTACTIAAPWGPPCP